MKYLLLVLLALSACANSKKAAEEQGLVLKEASYRAVTLGMERNDGKTSSTNYSFIFHKPEDVVFEKVWIYQTAFEFTEFDNEGDYYVSVKIYAGNRENVLKDQLPIDSKADAVLQYKDGGVTKYFEVQNLVKKEAIQGQ